MTVPCKGSVLKSGKWVPCSWPARRGKLTCRAHGGIEHLAQQQAKDRARPRVEVSEQAGFLGLYHWSIAGYNRQVFEGTDARKLFTLSDGGGCGGGPSDGKRRAQAAGRKALKEYLAAVRWIQLHDGHNAHGQGD